MEIERITIKLPPELKKEFKIAAIQNDSNMTDVLLGLIKQYVKENKKEN